MRKRKLPSAKLLEDEDDQEFVVTKLDVGSDERILSKLAAKPAAKKSALPSLNEFQSNECLSQTVKAVKPKIAFNSSAPQILFSSGNDVEMASGSKDLLQNIATQQKQNQASKITITAFAGDANMQDSVARRVSLSRALKIHSELMNSGVTGEQIEVKALGKPENESDFNKAYIFMKN